MARPGVQVIDREAAPSVASGGTWYVAGVTGRGPLGATPVASMAAYERIFGERTASTALLYDAAEVFFREGGSRLVVSRAVGPSATAATASLLDAASAAAFDATATSPGAWGNALSVEFTASGGGIIATVSDGGDVVATSPVITDPAELAAWDNPYVVFEQTGTDLPNVGTVTMLTGGSDDASNITDSEWGDALAALTADLGPGVVSIPGVTSSGVHAALLQAAQDTNRVAYLDAAELTSAVSLAAIGTGLAGDGPGERRAGLFGTWHEIPGVASGTVRKAAPSSLHAAQRARTLQLYNAAQPPAGRRAVARWALGPHAVFTEQEYEQLNEAGVNMARVVDGQYQPYGYRSLVPFPDMWWQLTGADILMAIHAEAYAIAGGYVFRAFDGRGHVLGELAGELKAMLTRMWEADMLYGATAAEAFSVEVGEPINTPEDLAAGIVRAVLQVRMAGFAELVVIEVVRRAITETINA